MNGGRVMREVLALGNVLDVEALCRSVLDRLNRSRGRVMEWEDYRDAIQELIGEAWRLWHEEYEPSRNASFASYAHWKLGCAAIDRFFRRDLGRTGGRILPPGSRSLAELEPGELDEALAAGPSDLADRGSPDLLRVLADRSRGAAQADAEVAVIAASPKGVSLLMKELRDELVVLAFELADETDDVIAAGELLFDRFNTEEKEPATA